MNAKSLADQLSLISTIIHRAKDCPEPSQSSDEWSRPEWSRSEWSPSSEMIMQAAAVLEKIPVVQDVNVSVAAPAVVADRS